MQNLRHPIIQNLILMIICVLFVVPFTLSCMSLYSDAKSSREAAKTDQIVAYIEDYRVVTNINGTSSNYLTTLVYNVNNQKYKTTISTTYPVAYAGQSIIVYAEPGNPYNVSPKITVEKFSISQKFRVVVLMVVIVIFAFIIKIVYDMDASVKYKDNLKLQKLALKNGITPDMLNNIKQQGDKK